MGFTPEGKAHRSEQMSKPSSHTEDGLLLIDCLRQLWIKSPKWHGASVNQGLHHQRRVPLLRDWGNVTTEPPCLCRAKSLVLVLAILIKPPSKLPELYQCSLCRSPALLQGIGAGQRFWPDIRTKRPKRDPPGHSRIDPSTQTLVDEPCRFR